jgi:hypothetical protein
VATAEADVVQAAVVAQGDDAGVVDAVVADAVVAGVDRGAGGDGLGPGRVGLRGGAPVQCPVWPDGVVVAAESVEQGLQLADGGRARLVVEPFLQYGSPPRPRSRGSIRVAGYADPARLARSCLRPTRGRRARLPGHTLTGVNPAACSSRPSPARAHAGATAETRRRSRGTTRRGRRPPPVVIALSRSLPRTHPTEQPSPLPLVGVSRCALAVQASRMTGGYVTSMPVVPVVRVVVRSRRPRRRRRTACG